MTFQAINPTTGDVVSSYDEMPPDMVKGIVDDVNEAFLGWRRTSFTERAKLMRKAAEGSAPQRQDEYARADDRRDGQADQGSPRRGREVRSGRAATMPSTARPILAD